MDFARIILACNDNLKRATNHCNSAIGQFRIDFPGLNYF